MNNLRTMFVLGGLGEGGAEIARSILSSIEHHMDATKRQDSLTLIGDGPDFEEEGVAMVRKEFPPSLWVPYTSRRILPSAWSQLCSFMDTPSRVNLSRVCELILEGERANEGSKPNTVVVIGSGLDAGWAGTVTDDNPRRAYELKTLGINFALLHIPQLGLSDGNRQAECVFDFHRAGEELGGVSGVIDFANQDSMQDVCWVVGELAKGSLPIESMAKLVLRTKEGRAFHKRCVKAFMNPRFDLR